MMEKITDSYFIGAKTEKAIRVLSLAILALLALLLILHKVIGFDEIIRNMYHGRSFGFLNNLIKYQGAKPVEHYISLGDILFYRVIFKSLIFLGFVNLVVRFIVFKKPPRPIWIFLFGTAVIMGIHILNPNNRIYSSHGFMHTGIVYEILNGHLPPNNPLLAEVPLYFPWGHHFLAAVFVKVFNISPSWAFCAINILSLLGIVFIIYKISRMLINCPRANNLSVFIALFAVSIAHTRGIPIIVRFTNISGMPVGVCFYLLFIYTILLIFSSSRKWALLLVPLVLSVAAVGFFYFQMLPGLLASFGVFFVFRVVRFLKDRKFDDVKKIIFTAFAVFIGVLLVLPYILSISVQAKSNVDIMVPAYVWSNFKNIAFISLPILIMIGLNFRSIKEKLNQQTLYDLLFFTVGVLITYLALRFPLKNEYKYLSQFMVLLGIIGGIAISFCSRRRSKVFAILLVLLLGCNFFINNNYKLKKKFNEPRALESSGRIVETGEEAEIYEWLLNNTTPDIAIIDTEIKTPYLAQRPLYAAKDTFINGQMKLQPGYAISMRDIFISISGHDEQMIDYRYGIIDKIYGMETSITDKELDDFFLTHPDILIIFRNKEAEGLLRDKLSLLFESSNRNFKIYRPGQLKQL